MTKHFKYFLAGLAYLVVGFFIVLGPLYLAQETGNDNWLYLYLFHVTPIIYTCGRSLLDEPGEKLP